MSFFTIKIIHKNYLPIKELAEKYNNIITLSVPNQDEPICRNPEESEQKREYDVVVFCYEEQQEYVLTCKNSGGGGLSKVFELVRKCFGTENKIKLEISITKSRNYYYKPSIINNEVTISQSTSNIAPESKSELVVQEEIKSDPIVHEEIEEIGEVKESIPQKFNRLGYELGINLPIWNKENSNYINFTNIKLALKDWIYYKSRQSTYIDYCNQYVNYYLTWAQKNNIEMILLGEIYPIIREIKGK